MAKKVNAQMATEIALDTLKTTNSLKNLTQVVKSTTAAWKSQEAMLKSTGDYLKASEARYNGLTDSISRQQAKIDALKSKQNGLNVETKEGASLHLKYQQQIEQATTKLNSMTSQQERARQSMELQKNGIIGLNQQIKQSAEFSKSVADRLRAEGKETQALKAEKNALKESIEKQNSLYKKEEDLLVDIAEKSGKTSDAYKKQQIRLNELGTKMATSKNRMSELNSEIKDIKTAPFTKVKNALSDINEKANKTHNVFGSIFTANLISNAASSVWNKLTSSISEAKDSAMEYATAQQTMNATWLTLTGNAKEGKKMVDMTNEMAVSAANSTDMVDSMNQKFYAITKNADITKGLTKSVLTLQDAFGATDDAVMNFSTQFAQMQANGKVSAQDMMSFVNTFPVLRTELLKTMQQQTGNSKLTMQQMNDLMSAGKISSETMDKVLTGTAKKYSSATENFAKTVPGLSRTIKSQMPVLIGNITQPLLKLQNPVLGTVSTWITDPKTHKKFTELGNNFSKEMNGVINSFTGGDASGSKEVVFDTLNRAVDGFNRTVSVTFGYISAHADDIKGITKDTWSIAKTIGGSVWGTFKGIIGSTADFLGIGGKNAKEMRDPLETIRAILDKLSKNKDGLETTGKVITGIFVAKKALAFASSIGRVTSALGELTQFKMPTSVAELFTSKSKVQLESTADEVANIGAAAEKSVTKTGLFTKALGSIGKVGGGLAVLDVGGSIVKSIVSNDAQDKIKAGGKTAGTAIGAGIGATLGSVIPGAGTLAGAGIGAAIGDALGSTKTAQKWIKNISKSLSGKTIKASKVKLDMSTDEKSLSATYNKLSKSLSKEFVISAKSDQKSLDAAQKSVNSTYEKMKKSVDSYYAEKEKKSASNLAKPVKQGALTQAEADRTLKKEKESDKAAATAKKNAYKAMQTDASSYYKQVKNIQNGGTKQLEEIAKKYGKKSQQYETEKNKELESAQKSFSSKYAAQQLKLNSKISSYLTKGTKEQKSILAKLNKDKDKLSIQDLSATQKYAKKKYDAAVKPARQTRDQIKKAANEQYESVKKTAEHEYKDTGSISKKQYEKIVKNAKQQRDDTSNAADSQYKKVTKHATNQYNSTKSAIEKQKKAAITAQQTQATNVGNYASSQSQTVVTHATNQANSSMKAGAKQAKGTNNIFSGLAKWWNKLAKSFGAKTATTTDATYDYTKVSNLAYASGGKVGQPGMALVGEEGPELKYSPFAKSVDILGARGAEFAPVKPGEFILNATDTAKLLNGSYGRTLPGYASGTSSLDDFLGEIKKSTSNIWDNISDTTQGIIDKITHPLKFFTDMANKIFNVTSIPGAGTFAQTVSKGIRDEDINSTVNLFSKFKKNAEDSGVFGDAGGKHGNPGGSGVQRWRADIKRALKANGLSISESMIQRIFRQMNTESGGNPKAVQPGADPDGDGSGPAIGLMQTKRGTFNANAFPGHKDIFNGYDNLLAALHYAKRTYGPSLGFLGNGHGYANGGLVTKEQLAPIAEGNRPEMIIPLDATKRSRATQLLGEVVTRFAAEDNIQGGKSINSHDKDSEELKALSNKFDTLLALIAQLLGTSRDQVEMIKATAFDKDALYKKQALDQIARDVQKLN